ncbi:histidine kinase [Chitinispirillum alkaliphilum]|nr:histidine kinase [Chitinispirillum alkaliphilum]
MFKKNSSADHNPLFSTDTKAERQLCFVRIILGSLYLFLVTFEILMGNTKPLPFILQLTALTILFSYSILNLSRSGKQNLPPHVFFTANFFDISSITLILYSYVLNSSEATQFINTALGTYFLAIIFTAFHHRMQLSIFCGILCGAAYSVLLYFSCLDSNNCNIWGHDHVVHLGFILSASVLSGFISRNNLKTSRQIISSELKYLSVVHRLPEMLFTLDSKGRFLWSNSASNSILGISETKITGKNLLTFLIDSDQLRFTKDGFRGTFEIWDINNNRKFVDCVLQYIQTENSQPLFEGIISDVTDRELAISQREEMKERLFQYQKMESLGTMASGMAHDFNNILQTVKDISAKVSSHSREKNTLQCMELINDTLTDAKFLVSELLALGRKNLINTDPVCIQKLLNSIVPLYGSQLGERYKISMDLPEEECYILGDWEYLKRIFQNLFGNARDAMPEGGEIFVRCSTESCLETPGKLFVRISDTGCGINPELQKKIFDPFFTTKDPGKGTGLGLALVQRIISLHKGNITVENSSSKGTVFCIELPLTNNRTLLSDAKIVSRERLSSTVLLLDDDPKIQEILRFYLKEFNYSTCEANNGASALKILKDHTKECEVVLMDWKLGTENPGAIIESLRKIKPDISIMIVSGYPAEPGSIDKYNIHRWFTKPYDKNMLDFEIQRILHGKNPALIEG